MREFILSERLRVMRRMCGCGKATMVEETGGGFGEVMTAVMGLEYSCIWDAAGPST